MIERPLSWFIVSVSLLSINAAILGFVFGQMTATLSYVAAPYANLPVSFLKENSKLSMTTQPVDILVRMRPEDEVHKQCRNSDAYACAQYAQEPCTVWLPSGQVIEFEPKTQLAWWEDFYNSTTIAHEFLHCFIPNWHEPYTELYRKKYKTQ
jgi:hypothetical protein